MPADVPPHADEVGSPDDGKGQPPPVTFLDADWHRACHIRGTCPCGDDQ